MISSEQIPRSAMTGLDTYDSRFVFGRWPFNNWSQVECELYGQSEGRINPWMNVLMPYRSCGCTYSIISHRASWLWITSGMMDSLGGSQLLPQWANGQLLLPNVSCFVGTLYNNEIWMSFFGHRLFLSVLFCDIALYSGVVHKPLCPTEKVLYLIAQDIPGLILEPGIAEGF